MSRLMDNLSETRPYDTGPNDIHSPVSSYKTLPLHQCARMSQRNKQRLTINKTQSCGNRAPFWRARHKSFTQPARSAGPELVYVC